MRPVKRLPWILEYKLAQRYPRLTPLTPWTTFFVRNETKIAHKDHFHVVFETHLFYCIMRCSLIAFSVDSSFFDDLSAMDISISGNLFLDLSIGLAGLSTDSIASLDYGNTTDLDFFFVINRFRLDAAVGSKSINLPVSFGNNVTMGLNDASFLVDIMITLDEPTEISDLFGDKAKSELTFDGSLQIVLPIEASVLDSKFTLIVSANDTDIFTGDGPLITYAYDLCAIKVQIESLFDGLSGDVISSLEENLRLDALPIPIDELTDPIIEKAQKVEYSYQKTNDLSCMLVSYRCLMYRFPSRS